jgi:tRNA-specific 2-thiouridylase
MKIAVGMSGGLDSTVTAALLVAEGHDVVGVTMKTWDGSVNLPPGAHSSCYSAGEAAELEAVRALAARLGIRHHTIPVEKEYRACVLDYFRREYLAGRTPNPCVRCNRDIKFGFLGSKARDLGVTFDRFATGHYARLSRDPATGRFLLKKGVDIAKDQSYFLTHLTQEQLSRAMFPLGDWTKTRVREKARELGLTGVADQAESQDFLGCGDYAPLFDGMDVKPGPIVDRAGRVLGRHRGIVYYTIGQRHGLGVSGQAEPLHVIAIDAGRNAVIVGRREDLMGTTLTAVDVNWIAIEGLEAPRRATARIRQQHPGATAVLRPASSGAVEVEFDAPQQAITPGQAVAFYDGDTVLGGGWIDAVSIRRVVLAAEESVEEGDNKAGKVFRREKQGFTP